MAINNFSWLVVWYEVSMAIYVWLQGFTYVAPSLLEELHRMEEEEKLQGPVGSKPRGPR